MKTTLIKIAFLALAAISLSCSSDSGSYTNQTNMSLNKTAANHSFTTNKTISFLIQPFCLFDLYQ